MAFLNELQLREMGFKSIGARVLISDKASVYGAPRITLSDDIRIDDFCVISAGTGGIDFGHNVHIACHCSVIGEARIEFHPFSGLSSHVAVYSSTDDYSGRSLTNPTVPKEFRSVQSAAVVLERHVIVGAGSVVLPGVTIGEGAAVGALSLVNRSLSPFTVNLGVPARRISARATDLRELELKYVGRAATAPT